MFQNKFHDNGQNIQNVPPTRHAGDMETCYHVEKAKKIDYFSSHKTGIFKDLPQVKGDLFLCSTILLGCNARNHAAFTII